MSIKRLTRLNLDVFTKNFFQQLFLDTDFTDVTLACDDGQVVRAHRVVLAFVSPFFRTILSNSSHPNPLVHIQGAEIHQIRQMLNFIYLGTIQIESDQLDAFLEATSRLKIDGMDKLNLGDQPDERQFENQNEEKDFAPKEANILELRESVIVKRFSDQQQSQRSDQDLDNDLEKSDRTVCEDKEENEDEDVIDEAESELKLENLAFMPPQLAAEVGLEKAPESMVDVVLAEEELKLNIFCEETLLLDHDVRLGVLDEERDDDVNGVNVGENLEAALLPGGRGGEGVKLEESNTNASDENLIRDDFLGGVKMEDNLDEQDDGSEECEERKKEVEEDNCIPDSVEKVKVEGADDVEDGANGEEQLANTSEAFKQKELKQEILDHVKDSSPAILSNPVQNKKRKRSKGGSWTRAKRTSSRNVLKIKTEEEVLDRSLPILEINPYHDSSRSSEEGTKLENKESGSITNKKEMIVKDDDHSQQRDSDVGGETKVETVPPKKVRVLSLPPTRRSTRASARALKVTWQISYLISYI